MIAVIARIARHEIRLAWRSRAIVVLALALTALAGGAAVVGHARFRADAEHRSRYQQVVGEQFASQPDRHPHRVAHYGFLVFRPRAPLGFFDSGIESYAGTSIFLEAHRQNTANFSAASQSGATSRFGELTLALVLQVLAPLFIFGLAGVSVTREREAGTLPLLLCQGASWGAVLLGKLAGTIAVVAAVVAPGVIVSAGWLLRESGSPWTPDHTRRMLLLLAIHGVFLTACAALAVVVSAWQRTSRGALTVLLGVWVALWMVLPRLLPAAGNAIYPVPARAEFTAEVERRVRELGDSHNPNDPKFAGIRARALAEHGAQRVEDLPFNYSGFVMQQSERMTSEAFQAHMAALIDVYRRQARLVDAAGIASPFIGVRMLSMAIAGSDAAHVLEFDRQAEAYRFDLIQKLNDLHRDKVPLAADRYAHIIEGAPSRLRIDRALFQRLPPFDYEPPAIGWSLAERRHGAFSFLVSVALVAAAFMWTARRRALLA